MLKPAFALLSSASHRNVTWLLSNVLTVAVWFPENATFAVAMSTSGHSETRSELIIEFHGVRKWLNLTERITDGKGNLSV